MRFEAGRVVVHRDWHGDYMGLVKTAVVAADDERGLLLWLPEGAPIRFRQTLDGRGPRSMTFAEWLATPTELAPARWQGFNTIKLLPPGAAHSVWWFFTAATGEFAGWYVNLEEPYVRWDDGHLAGVDYVDQDLDIVVRPDGSWEWKDEDEFTERLAYPEHYWVSDETAVRAEGERVIKRIEAGEFPFDGSLLDYVPDPAWRVPPELPAGWDRPRAWS